MAKIVKETISKKQSFHIGRKALMARTKKNPAQPNGIFYQQKSFCILNSAFLILHS